jgi:hypothetical protein
MPGSRASVFGEAEDFQAALSADGVAAMYRAELVCQNCIAEIGLSPHKIESNDAAVDSPRRLRVTGELATGRGRFRARMTQLALESIRLAAVEEVLPRIAFIAVPAGMGRRHVPDWRRTLPGVGRCRDPGRRDD